MFKSLMQIANELDNRGLVKEADYLDYLIKRAGEDESGFPSWWDELGSASLGEGSESSEDRGLDLYEMNEDSEHKYSDDEAKEDMSILTSEEMQEMFSNPESKAQYFKDMKMRSAEMLSRMSSAVSRSDLGEVSNYESLYKVLVKVESLVWDLSEILPNFDMGAVSGNPKQRSPEEIALEEMAKAREIINELGNFKEGHENVKKIN
jgi:hypothetical protein